MTGDTHTERLKKLEMIHEKLIFLQTLSSLCVFLCGDEIKGLLLKLVAIII